MTEDDARLRSCVVSCNPAGRTENDMTTRTEERKQFLADIFTTALEGGIGYWSVAETYHWTNGDVADLDGFYADIEDLEDDNHKYRIDQAVIVKGVNTIANAKAPFYDPNGATQEARAHKGGVEYLSEYVANTVRAASFANDGGEIDAGIADCIVQVGLFGKVVYG